MLHLTWSGVKTAFHKNIGTFIGIYPKYRCYCQNIGIYDNIFDGFYLFYAVFSLWGISIQITMYLFQTEKYLNASNEGDFKFL